MTRVGILSAASRGHAVNPDLLGDDRPDPLAEFYLAEREWVATGA